MRPCDGGYHIDKRHEKGNISPVLYMYLLCLFNVHHPHVASSHEQVIINLLVTFADTRAASLAGTADT